MKFFALLLAAILTALAALPSTAEAHHRHHRSHHSKIEFVESRGAVEGHRRYASPARCALGCRIGRKGKLAPNAKLVAGFESGPRDNVSLPPDRLMTLPEAKILLRSVDAALAPALLTNLDLDFAKACLMQYGLKRLEEMKREAER
jgi:hypothetical protein